MPLFRHSKISWYCSSGCPHNSYLPNITRVLMLTSHCLWHSSRGVHVPTLYLPSGALPLTLPPSICNRIKKPVFTRTFLPILPLHIPVVLQSSRRVHSFSTVYPTWVIPSLDTIFYTTSFLLQINRLQVILKSKILASL